MCKGNKPPLPNYCGILGTTRGVTALGQPVALQKGLWIEVPAHEIAEEFLGRLGITLGEHLGPQFPPHLGVQDPFLEEAGEGVGLEGLGPLVRIIAGGVACGVREEVVEPAGHGRASARDLKPAAAPREEPSA